MKFHIDTSKSCEPAARGGHAPTSSIQCAHSSSLFFLSLILVCADAWISYPPPPSCCKLTETATKRNFQVPCGSRESWGPSPSTSVVSSHLSLSSLKLRDLGEKTAFFVGKIGVFSHWGEIPSAGNKHHPHLSLYKHPKESLANGLIFAGHTF